jgi:hypothetical protein
MKVRVPGWSAPNFLHTRARSNILRAALAFAACAFGPAGRAQPLAPYFPPGVPGFDMQRGVTVLTRERPLFENLGLHAGDFLVHADAGQSVGEDTDVTGQASGPASAVARTDASVLAGALWSQAQLGLAADVGENVFGSLPDQDRTDYAAAAGAGAAVGRQVLGVGYAHRLVFQTGNDIGQLRADAPVREEVDDARASDRVALGWGSLTPNLEVSSERFGPARVGGLSLPQAFRDRDAVQAGVTGRSGPAEERSLLLVLLGVASLHPDRPAGQPDYDQTGALAMAGVDYPSGGVWRYQLLGGVERRAFRDARFSTRVAPVAQAAAIWTPDGMTTVTAQLSRSIEDTSAEGSSGAVYTTARVVLDHEYLRNVLLQARVRLQSAAFAQAGGTQTGAGAGAGATWLVDRHVRVSLNYDFSAQSGGAAAGPGASARVERHLLLLSVRWGL